MGEDSKKSFWTSMPGILTGIAAVLVAVGGIFTALNIDLGPQSTSPSQPEPTVNQNPESMEKSSPSSQSVCGTQLPSLNLFGIWKWFGNSDGSSLSGVLSFKSDCTYTNIVNGIESEDKGTFTITSNPDEIRFFSNSGNEHTYSISKVFENSFHLSDLKETVSLDLVRQL